MFNLFKSTPVKPHYKGYDAETNLRIDQHHQRIKKTRVKAKAPKKYFDDFDENNTVRSITLFNRIAIGFSKFSDKCSIAWKKLCLNCCLTSAKDRQLLKEEISDLEDKIKYLDNKDKTWENTQTFKAACNNNDVKGALSSGASAIVNGAKTIYYS